MLMPLLWGELLPQFCSSSQLSRWKVFKIVVSKEGLFAENPELIGCKFPHNIIIHIQNLQYSFTPFCSANGKELQPLRNIHYIGSFREKHTVFLTNIILRQANIKECFRTRQRYTAISHWSSSTSAHVSEGIWLIPTRFYSRACKVKGMENLWYPIRRCQTMVYQHCLTTRSRFRRVTVYATVHPAPSCHWRPEISSTRNLCHPAEISFQNRRGRAIERRSLVILPKDGIESRFVCWTCHLCVAA